ncbi:magnesium and cobalt transport protein CorA [Ferrovibrio terrae]|uniref:Magnesium and cobalt transport protein CorA n=1 Tax=Ferrovibrio terrae TaxID=2594003 RepID=A0A516GWL7_9PROT|nr:magnesium and cobalt transport protein CorA [Ferrovibrio terrae]QDO95933.1 magnesium and cobalt transport protein CorA [Ferrovibrio terrae]
MKGVVACAAYGDGTRLGEVPFESCGTAVPPEADFVWIGLHEPEPAALKVLQQQFGLHPLAIEDAERAHQRPKLDIYGESIFVVLRTVRLVDGIPEYGETHVFVGKGYVISVRHGASSSYAEVRGKLESKPEMLRLGESAALHAIIDFVTDNFFPVIDDIQNELTEIETHVLDETLDRKSIERLYHLRRQLLGMRGTVLPLLEVSNRLSRLDLPMMAPELRPYFGDVHDHVQRVAEAITDLRDAAAAAFEAEILLANTRQNDVVRQLAAWAAILAVPTAIAGIYGMNFEHMPELRWAYGYPMVLAGIVAACGFLYWRFRRSGWL